MKTIDGPSIQKMKIKLLISMALSIITMISCYYYYGYTTYQSIEVTIVDSGKVEFGSANYNIKKVVKEVEGKIVSVKQDIDTSVLGEQEVLIEVKKYNIVKEIPVMITVVDTVAPNVVLKEEKITITEGDDYNLVDNIESVIDEIDGQLEYLDEITEESTNYYHISYEDDLDSVGEHVISVSAVDKSGNLTVSQFTLEVEPKPVYHPVYYNLPPNASGNDLVSIAYSLIGSPYVYNGAGPYGFDCSGFVHYVYSLVGIYVSRSTYSQQFDGYPVSYQDAQPGDILLWGYGDGNISHSALYIGNGQMIHATNPSQGVILSDVNYWLNGSGTYIVSVRRIQ